MKAIKRTEPLLLRGSMVALVTPFKGGKIDKRALKKLIDFHVANGTDAIVPCGTTGESATLSHEEHTKVVEMTLEYVDGRIPVVAGTGSNSTEEAIQLTKHAERAGADAALLITPYYNKPTQEGLYQHFRAVAREVRIPIILYNVPARTSVNLLPETICRLTELKNIKGIKEATGDLKQIGDLITLCGDRMTVLSGDDFTTLPILAIGGKGVISVTANVAPRDVSDMVHAYLRGDEKDAVALHTALWPLHKAMFLETNPIPAKTALGMMGMINPEMRLPLVPLSQANREKLAKTLKAYGLIK